MAKAKVKVKYDPNAEYVCIKGTISIREEETNNPTLISSESVDDNENKVRFKMSHRTPGQVAYLVEGAKMIQLAADYDKANPQAQGGKA